MANDSWITVVAMCLSPALILFIVAGLVALGKKLKVNKLSSSEEIDHEL